MWSVRVFGRRFISNGVRSRENVSKLPRGTTVSTFSSSITSVTSTTTTTAWRTPLFAPPLSRQLHYLQGSYSLVLPTNRNGSKLISSSSPFDKSLDLRVQKRYQYQRPPLELPYFPFGVVRSLILPILVALLTAGGALYLAKSPTVREWRRRSQREAFLRLQSGRASAVERWWYTFPEWQRAISPLMLANCLVFLAWQVQPLKGFMSTYFLSSTMNPRVLPLLLSNISHSTGMHFLFNMIAFTSFSQPVHAKLGTEQMWALILGGAVSCTVFSRLIQLATRNATPSLGLSGVVCSFLMVNSYFYPDSRLMLIFLPFFSFPQSSLIPCLIAFDAVGLFGRVTRLFSIGNLDHAGHLGGVGFGFLFATKLQDRRRR